MRKQVLFLSILVFLVGLGAANEVYYEIDIDKDKTIMDTTVRLDCEDELCPNLKWEAPANARLLNVTDGKGETKEYTEENGGLIIEADGRDSEFEFYKMSFRIDRDAEEIFDGLYQREMSLRSFKDAETTGRVHVEDFLSSWTGFGVETSVNASNLSFRSEGPLNFRVKFGKGYSTEYYEFFGGEPENTSIAYEVPVGTTGEQLQVKKLPVAILPDEVFNRTVSRWSSGEYVSGSAKMRQGLKDEFLPVLAHETVHALNERELKWDQTSSSYFEEGTSRYVEYLVRKKLYGEGRIDKPIRELFGESVRYDPDPDDRYYQELPSKGNKDVLWGYYLNDQDFMKRWNPFDSRPEYRGFGYAYSELIIKNYIARMNGSLRELYEKVNVSRKISDPQEKWNMFSELVDTTPCKYESRERFNKCLETINDHTYTVYSAEPSASDLNKFEIKKLEVPDRSEDKEKLKRIDLNLRENMRSGSLLEILERLFYGFVGFLENLIRSLG